MNNINNPSQSLAKRSKKQKSSFDFFRNNSLKEFMNFYKSNKNDPNFKKNRNTFIKQKSKNYYNNTSMITVENMHIINETLSQHTEKQFFNNKYRCFLGKDILDKIYFCPDDNIIIFNYEEANRIGVMLLEMLRYETELADYEFLFKQISQRYNEECDNLKKEKERIYEEYVNYILLKIFFLIL